MILNHGNTGLKQKRRKPVDVEARMIARLPKEIRHWLLYDAVSSFHVSNIAKIVKNRGAKDAMEFIKKKQAELTAKAYGFDHPQAYC